MRNRGDVGDRRIFHVEIVLADEDNRKLPHRSEVQRLVEGSDIGRAVAKKADRYILLALVLRPPGSPAGNRQMRPDDRIGAHYAAFDGSQVHGATLAAHETVVALHQL